MPPRSPQTYTAPATLPSVSGAITLKAVTDLPARLYGGNAQEVEVSGLDYTLHLDIEKLAVAEGSTPANKWTVVWDSAADTYGRVPLSSVPIAGLDTKVNKAGDIMTGGLTVQATVAARGFTAEAPPGSDPFLTLNKPASGRASYISGLTGSSARWTLSLGDGTAEGGSNVGSDFTISRYADNATLLGTPLNIKRSTGDVAIATATPSTSTTTGALTIAGGLGVASGVRVGGASSIQSAVGVALPTVGSTLGIGYHGTTNFGVAFRPTVDNGTAVYFANAANTVVGTITNTAAATAYNTSSDIRLKEDMQRFDAGGIIDATEVYDFRWKATGDRAIGIAAQQAAEVYPQAITHDETTDWWGVDYSKFVPLLLAELKALRARVAALEGE